MPKKNMSPEERKAFGEKMKAARAAKKPAEHAFKDAVDGSTSAPEPQTTYSDADIADLIRQVQELKKQNYQPQQGIQSSSDGRLIGTFEKYGVDPQQYPNPVTKLTNEAKLARFAFPINYELIFDVAVSSYQTQDGINTKEPRFTLQLIKIVMDEESGDPTNGRYMLNQMIFHEDPQAALIVAGEHGIPVDEQNEAHFLNEMRYLRMRDWLFDIFYPKPAQSKKNRREEVIGNRLVEVYEVSGADPQAIPFDKIAKISI